MTPQTLLFVVNRGQFFLSHRLPVALAAQKAGYDVHVAVADGPDLDTVRAFGFKIHTVPLERSSLMPHKELQTITALAKLYRMVKPDLVHHVTIKPVLYGTLAARIAGVPAIVNAVSGLGHIYTSVGAIAKVRRGLVNVAYRSILQHKRLRLIFQNDDDYGTFLAAKIVTSENVTFIKGMGADLNRFTAVPEPGGPPIILLPARLLQNKGVCEFVSAAYILRKKGHEARFVLVGEIDHGNPTAIPETQLDQWVSEGLIEWWGYQGDMPATLKKSHIICLPSYREGLPKALVEAAACGKPIVTTNVPGCRDVVRDGDNGLLVPVREVTALADALETLITNPDLRAQMGRRGRERAEAEFSLESVVDKHLVIYRELLSGL